MLRDFLLPYAQHFRARGWRVDALARRDDTYDECAAAFDTLHDISWTRSPLAIRQLLRTPQQIRALVEHGGYDIVHVHTPIAGFITRFALRDLRRRGRVAVAHTAHGFHFDRNGIWYRRAVFAALEKLAGRWTDALIVINDAEAEAARRFRLVSPCRLHAMPGIGIDLSRYDPTKVTNGEIAAVRAELGLAKSDALFLMIAKHTANKNHRHAVAALAYLGRADVHLAFAGYGDQMEAVRRLAEAAGVGERVHFLGHRRDIPVLMRAAVATLLISSQEGLSRSVTEALYLGTPVIGADIHGTHALLASGGGLLVPVGDIARLAEAMEWLITHPDAARAMGQQGRAGVQRYDLHHLIALHERLYAEMVASALVKEDMRNGVSSAASG